MFVGGSFLNNSCHRFGYFGCAFFGVCLSLCFFPLVSVVCGDILLVRSSHQNISNSKVRPICYCFVEFSVLHSTPSCTHCHTILWVECFARRVGLHAFVGVWIESFHCIAITVHNRCSKVNGTVLRCSCSSLLIVPISLSFCLYLCLFFKMSQRLTVRDVSGAAFIKAYAEHLKKGGKLEIPKWAEYIKTGVAKELGPIQEDWYYTRAGKLVRAKYCHDIGN